MSDVPRRSRAPLGLALTPIVIGLAALIFSRVSMRETAADLVVFIAATTTSIGALALSARSHPRWPWRAGALALSACALGAAAWSGSTSAIASFAVDTALVAMGWAIGGSIGRAIEHPGHLLPACVVVACADATSVVSSFGPTHAIAENERVLSVVAFAFPVPGTTYFAPTLGAGDLIFIALVMGAAAAHGISIVRAALLCWAGTLAAGLGSAVLAMPVPALVPIGAAVVLGIPEARKVRKKERRVAMVAMTIAIAVAATTIVFELVHPASRDTEK
jgi:hypothetical protein